MEKNNWLQIYFVTNMTFLALKEKKMKKYRYWWPILFLVDLVLMFIAVIGFIIVFIII